MMPQQYCLRWKYHHSNLQNMFSQLLDRGCFCDVTLACEGQTLKAHRVVLCACSTYFDSILTNCSVEKDPIIIMKDCKFADVKCLIEFMYKGEINVEHNNLASLLKTAEELRIKGLAEVSWRDDEKSEEVERKSRKSNNNTNNHNNSMNNNNNINNNISSSVLPAPTTTDHHPSFTPITLNNNNSPQHHQQLDTSDDQQPMPLLAPISSPSNLSPNENARGSPLPPIKRKRGRPPLDGEFDSYNRPKIANVDRAIIALNKHSSRLIAAAALIDENSQEINQQILEQSINRMQHEDEEDRRADSREGAASVVDDEQQHKRDAWFESNLEVQMNCDDESSSSRIIPKLERPETPPNYSEMDDESFDIKCPFDGDASTSVMLTAQEQEDWKDVIKMNDYLTRGRRPQFWEEPFTKRVMEAIKTKDLEMKKAASLLGVSYGTLYGRYRETYGCLKHPYRGPFMVSRLWTEQGPAEIIGLLQKGVITLPRAAELMNTSPSSLSGLLDQAQEWNLSNERDQQSDSDDKEIINKILPSSSSTPPTANTTTSPAATPSSSVITNTTTTAISSSHSSELTISNIAKKDTTTTASPNN